MINEMCENCKKKLGCKYYENGLYVGRCDDYEEKDNSWD